MSEPAPVAGSTATNIRIAGRRLELTPHHCFACGTLNEHGLRLTLHIDIEGAAGTEGIGGTGGSEDIGAVEGHGGARGDGGLVDERASRQRTRCWTELELDRRFEGWEGIAHGGIVSTILDEVMAWSLVERELWGLTVRLNVAFRRPVPIGRRIRAEGWVVKAEGRLVRTAGRVVEPTSGLVLATAEAAYLPAPEDRQRAFRERYRFRLVPETDPASRGSSEVQPPSDPVSEQPEEVAITGRPTRQASPAPTAAVTGGAHRLSPVPRPALAARTPVTIAARRR